MANTGPVPQIPATEVPAGAYLLDVREHEEWDAGHAPGAVHIPLGELGARYTELDRDRPLPAPRVSFPAASSVTARACSSRSTK